MPEARYPDYKLFPAVFQAWLRHTFEDDTINVKVSLTPEGTNHTYPTLTEFKMQSVNGQFVFNLPEGREISGVCCAQPPRRASLAAHCWRRNTSLRSSH